MLPLDLGTEFWQGRWHVLLTTCFELQPVNGANLGAVKLVLKDTLDLISQDLGQEDKNLEKK